jgi:autotransporter-associated beta strand protein
MATQYFSVGATGDPGQLTSWTNSGGANPANFTSGDTFVILNGCNFTLASAETWAVNASTAGTAATVQINNGGTLTFTLSGSSCELAIGGNLVQAVTGGIAGSGTSATGVIDFTSSGAWTGSGNLSSPKVGITIDAAATLDASGMTSGFVLRSGNTEGITVNGTLIMGANNISGNGGSTTFFTLNGGGTLVTANTAGVPGTFTGFASGKITLSSSANYTFNGSAAQVTGTSANNATMPTTVNSLTFSNNAGITLSQATTASSVALLAGQVTGNVILADGGTISGGSSTAYINGQLTVQFDAPSSASFTFPIGTASAYSPIGITNFTDTGSATLTASASVGQDPNQPTSGIDLTEYINRTWTLTAGSGFNSPTYNFTGAFVAGDILNGANPATLIVSKWDGTSWAAPASSASLGSPTYTVTGTGFNTDFGQFTAGAAAFLPSVIATTASAITNTTATLGATVYANNGSTINNYGIVWGTSPNPTLANHVVSAGSSPMLNSPFTVNATGLPAATTVYYCGFATSGNGTGYSTNGSFLTFSSQPTVQASAMNGTALQNGNLLFSWVRGNGSNCIVLVSAGSPVSSPPVSGTTYTASATFGSGSQIGSGYVAFIGTGTNVTLTGLSPNSTYYVAVYEFDGSGGSQNYLIPPATGSQTTVGNPVSSITWTGSQDNNWNNANNWNPLLVPGVGTFAIIPNVGNQPVYTNPMVAASFGSFTNAGILTVATNGFNSGSAFLERAGGGAQMIITNNGAMVATGNIALASNSVVTVYGGASLTASGQLIIGCNITNAGSSTGAPGSIGIVTNNGGTIAAGSTSLNPGNGSVTSGCLFVINGGTNTLGSVTIARSSAGSGGYSTLGSEGLMIYGGQVTMSGLNVGGGNGNSFLTALISGGTVTNNGSVFVNQGSSGRGSRLLQTGGLFVVTNQVNPNPTVSGSLNVYSVTGGTNFVGGIAFGTATGAGSVFFTNSAVVYVGSQGISASNGATLTATLNGGGLFGASAPWTGSAPMSLSSGLFTFQTADMNNNPNNITLTGVLGGLGGLNKTGGGTLTLNAADSYSGNTVVSSGTLVLGSSATLSSLLIDVGPGALFDVSALGGAFSPAAGQTLGGFGSVNGLVTANKGTIQPGTNSVTGTLTLSSGLTETGGAVNKFVLSSDPVHGSNDLLAVTGNLTLSGSNTVAVIGTLPNGANYTLITYSGSLSGGIANFGLSGVTGYLTNVANSIVLHTLATTRGPTNIVWDGNPVNNLWNSEVTTNWLNAGALDYFIPGDSVNFTDVGGSNSQVILAGDLFPASVTVSSTSNYLFSGTGFIDGSTGLTKTNTGILTILTTNNYSGPTTISGGTLEASLIADALSPSGIGNADGTDSSLLVLTNGGTLRYIGGTAASTDRGLTLAGNGGIAVTNGSILTISGTIVGAGTLTKADNGVLSLNNANANSGGVTIGGGTLTLPNATGAGSGTIIGGNGTTLSIVGAITVVNQFNVPSGTVTVDLNNAGGNTALDGAWSGAGTVVIVDQEPTSGRTMTMGGNGSGGGSMVNFTGTIELGTNSESFRFNDGGGNANTGNTNLTLDLGTSTATFLVRNGGVTIDLGALKGGSGTFLSGRGNGTSGTVTYSIGGNNLSTEFAGIIEDGGNATAITKVGTGTLVLANADTYTGNTTISGGTLCLTNDPNIGVDGSINSSASINLAAGTVLDVSSLSNPMLQVGSAQTLEGRGTITGSLSVNGGTVAPGGGPGGNTGTLTVTNSVTLGGTAWMKLNRANTPNSDQVVSSLSTMTYGGTLAVTNIGPRLQVGDTFTLFSGAGLSGGTFGTISLPNYYNWDDSNLGVNGTVRVTGVLPAPTVTSVDFSTLSSGTITLSAVNGLPNGPVNVLTTTNLALPVSSWTTVTTASFDGNGNLNQSISVNPELPQSYFLLQAY